MNGEDFIDSDGQISHQRQKELYFKAFPQEIILVRHAESLGNTIADSGERTKLELPTHQYPLTEKGREQARVAGDFLRRKKIAPFDDYFVSTYRRSRETMQIMFPEANLIEDPRLDEANRGIWHNMSEEEVMRQIPWELARKNQIGLYHYRPIGGENWPDVELRIRSFIETLRNRHTGRKVAICCHGSWQISWHRVLNNFPPEESIRRYNEEIALNTQIAIYQRQSIRGCDAGWKLVLTEEKIIPE